MTTTITDPLLNDYLRELERAARALPRSQREELLAEIRDHLDSGLGPDASRADVRNLLDDLGRPADIVSAAQPDRVPTRRGPREVFALILLVTRFPPIVGWLAGVGLLLWSPLWTARQKLLGILVWPGGLVAAIGVGLALAPTSNRISCDWTEGGEIVPGSCISSDTGVHPAVVAIILAVVVVASILVAAYLSRSTIGPEPHRDPCAAREPRPNRRSARRSAGTRVPNARPIIGAPEPRRATSPNASTRTVPMSSTRARPRLESASLIPYMVRRSTRRDRDRSRTVAAGHAKHRRGRT